MISLREEPPFKLSALPAASAEPKTGYASATAIALPILMRLSALMPRSTQCGPGAPGPALSHQGPVAGSRKED